MTRGEAIKTLKENYCAMCAYGSQDMDSCDIRSCDNKDAIKALEQGPSDKSKKPKTGKWIKTISENGITSAVRCSICGFEDNRYMLFRYCPNCGAKMEDKE